MPWNSHSLTLCPPSKESISQSTPHHSSSIPSCTEISFNLPYCILLMPRLWLICLFFPSSTDNGNHKKTTLELSQSVQTLYRPPHRPHASSLTLLPIPLHPPPWDLRPVPSCPSCNGSRLVVKTLRQKEPRHFPASHPFHSSSTLQCDIISVAQVWGDFHTLIPPAMLVLQSL